MKGKQLAKSFPCCASICTHQFEKNASRTQLEVLSQVDGLNWCVVHGALVPIIQRPVRQNPRRALVLRVGAARTRASHYHYTWGTINTRCVSCRLAPLAHLHTKMHDLSQRTRAICYARGMPTASLF